MRISIDETDRGFEAWMLAGGHSTKWDITVDGVQQDWCVMADQELGEVRRHALDENGKHIIDIDEVRTETVFGKVIITRRVAT